MLFFIRSLFRLYPEWKVDSKFITAHLNDALDLDAKLSSHPIEVQCPDANKINQVSLKHSWFDDRTDNGP